MTDYVRTTDFGAKDALASGNPAKIVKGVELNTEFNALSTSSATKEDKANKGVANGYLGLGASSGIVVSGASSFSSTLGVTGVTTLSNQLSLTSTNPFILFSQSGAAANNKDWGFQVAAEQLSLFAWNDAHNAAQNILTVDRTANTIDSIAMTATTVSIAGLLTSTGGITVSGGNITLTGNSGVIGNRGTANNTTTNNSYVSLQQLGGTENGDIGYYNSTSSLSVRNGISGASIELITAGGGAVNVNGVSVNSTAVITSGTFADARIAQTNVTQHQAALALAGSQITSGTLPDARIAVTGVTQHQASLSIACSQLTGTLADARLVSSNVTQFQASLSIAGSQLTGTVPTGVMTGSYTGITAIGNATVNDSAGSPFSAGFREVPQNSQSAAYQFVLADNGKHVYHPSADTTARTFTIPANGTVAFPIGTVLTFVNDTSAGVVTIAITTDTMVQAGTGATGSRTLAANGMATAIKVTATRWMISGTGLT